MNPALVVISHYNAWPADQLLALLDQTRSVPAGHPFRTLVVVNRAIDRDLRLPPEHGDVEILYRENTGYNIGAWDHGWRAGPPAGCYLFLQEECRILRPGWLDAFVRRLSRPGVGLVGESMSYARLSWERLAHIYRRSLYEDLPGSPPVPYIDGIVRFLESRSVPIGQSGEHLQSLVLATRRDVLEAIGGFMIGRSKGDAIACEIGISRAVAAAGMKLEQVGRSQFRYVLHPQWEQAEDRSWQPLFDGIERFAPISAIHPARDWLCRFQAGVRRLRAGLRKTIAG